MYLVFICNTHVKFTSKNSTITKQYNVANQTLTQLVLYSPVEITESDTENMNTKQ